MIEALRTTPGPLLADDGGKETGRVTVLTDSIKRWCEQESLAITVERDDETGFAGDVSLPDAPALSVRVRASAGEPTRVSLSHAFELPIPAEIAADAEAAIRIADLVERVAASRSSLLECRHAVHAGKATIEVVVTLHEDGMTKQGFLTALEEISKVRRILEWELDAMAQAVGLISDVQSGLGAIVERSEALASDAAAAVQEFDVPAAAAEPAPPAEPPPPTPVPSGVAAPAGGVFCAECGRQARPGARFCKGCGASLEA